MEHEADVESVRSASHAALGLAPVAPSPDEKAHGRQAEATRSSDLFSEGGSSCRDAIQGSLRTIERLKKLNHPSPLAKRGPDLIAVRVMHVEFVAHEVRLWSILMVCRHKNRRVAYGLKSS